MLYFLIQIKGQIEGKMGQIEENIGCIDWTNHHLLTPQRSFLSHIASTQDILAPNKTYVPVRRD
jgi:hypothetical protein